MLKDANVHQWTFLTMSRFSDKPHKLGSLGTHIFMSLQQILMKLRIFTKFGMIN